MPIPQPGQRLSVEIREIAQRLSRAMEADRKDMPKEESLCHAEAASGAFRAVQPQRSLRTSF
jgi:hypothetical protein